MKYRVEQNGQRQEVELEHTSDGWLVREPGGATHRLRFEERADGSLRAFTPWGEFEIWAARAEHELWASVSGRRLAARVERQRPTASGDQSVGRGDVFAPMPGKLLRVLVQPGDTVQAGQAIAVIEAMKMENELLAPQAGVVRELLAVAPSTLEKGALIARIEAP